MWFAWGTFKFASQATAQRAPPQQHRALFPHNTADQHSLQQKPERTQGSRLSNPLDTQAFDCSGEVRHMAPGLPLYVKSATQCDVLDVLNATKSLLFLLGIFLFNFPPFVFTWGFVFISLSNPSVYWAVISVLYSQHKKSALKISVKVSGEGRYGVLKGGRGDRKERGSKCYVPSPTDLPLFAYSTC